MQQKNSKDVGVWSGGGQQRELKVLKPDGASRAQVSLTKAEYVEEPLGSNRQIDTTAHQHTHPATHPTLRKKCIKHQRKSNNTSHPTQHLQRLPSLHLLPRVSPPIFPDFALSLNAGSGGTGRETFIFPIALSELNDKPTSASWICSHCYVVNAVDTIVVAGEVVVDHEEQAESPG
ncbi:hypothetical protein BDQ17DRAFT_1329900 [Cyathus striatus]|nr:hypothetical protein BDQ17DRAFT_1329900 [Cyathus striatus]